VTTTGRLLSSKADPHPQMGIRNTTFLLIAVLLTMGHSVLAQERVVFQDDFSGNAVHWPEVSDDLVHARLEANAYRMETRRADGTQLFLMDETPLDPQRDFEISAMLLQHLGAQEDGFGLVFGAADKQNYHAFTVNSAGQFRVTQYKNGNLNEIKPFTQFKQPLHVGKKNKLSIRKKSALLSFYLNDAYAYSMPFQGFAGTPFCFVAYNKMDISASDLVVRQGNPMPEIFEDLFETNQNNWISAPADSVKCVYARGNLVMRGVKSGAQTTNLRENLLNTEREFELEFNIKQILGSQDLAYGVMWGASDENNGFQFLINTYGSFCVQKMESGKTAVLVDWTPSLQALHLRTTPNKLSIRKSGQQYNFFLNDLWLAQLPFHPFSGHKMGFVLTHYMRMEMEYMVVREGEISVAPEPPVVEILSPESSGNVVDAKRIQFKAGVKSKTKLKGLKLTLNGEVLQVQATKDVSGTYDLMVDQELSLKSGANEIALHAKTEDGIVQKAVTTVTFKTPEAPVTRNGVDHALFFATGDYLQWSDLVNPVNDARTIAEELETNYGFNTELVIDASQKEILAKLKEYARKSYRDGDQLLVFFAGHGKFDEYFGEGYVVCTDSEKDDEGNKSYISHSSLRTIIGNIPCKHTFLVMDVCFGGTIDPFIATSTHRGMEPGMNYNPDATHEDFVERKLKFKTRRYLTSGGKEYVPDGAPGAHSPFARKFLEALRNYGGPDRIITLGELVLFFDRLTPEPRFGEFGTNEPGSDFLFIAR